MHLAEGAVPHYAAIGALAGELGISVLITVGNDEGQSVKDLARSNKFLCRN